MRLNNFIVENELEVDKRQKSSNGAECDDVAFDFMRANPNEVVSVLGTKLMLITHIKVVVNQQSLKP